MQGRILDLKGATKAGLVEGGGKQMMKSGGYRLGDEGWSTEDGVEVSKL